VGSKRGQVGTLDSERSEAGGRALREESHAVPPARERWEHAICGDSDGRASVRERRAVFFSGA
jgi:hypothetical protein